MNQISSKFRVMTCLKGAQPVEALDEATRIFESIILKSTSNHSKITKVFIGMLVLGPFAPKTGWGSSPPSSPVSPNLWPCLLLNLISVRWQLSENLEIYAWY